MKCLNCGFEINDSKARFCPECGGPLVENAEETLDAPEAEAALIPDGEADEAAKSTSPEPDDVFSSPAPDMAEDVMGSSDISSDNDIFGDFDLPAEDVTEEAAPVIDMSDAPIIEPAPAIEEAPVIEPAPDFSPAPDMDYDMNNGDFAPVNVFEENNTDYGSAYSAPAEEPVPDAETAPENEPENAPEPAPETPIKVGAVRLTGASIIAFFAAVVLFAVCVIFCVKLGVTGDNLRRRVIHMNEYTLIGSDCFEVKTYDRLYKAAGIEKATHNFADEKEFAIYLMQTDYMRFLGDKVKAYTNFIMDGKGKDPSVTTNEIVDFLMEYDDMAEKTFGYKMQTADYNAIRTSLESNEALEYLKIDNISKMINFRLENASFIFSYLTVGIFFTLAVVLMIWIAVITDKRAKYLLGFYGNIFFWSGSLTFLIGLALTAGTSIMAAVSNEFIFHASAALLMPTGVYALCIGGGLAVIGSIMRRKKNKMKLRTKIERKIAKENA